MYTDLRIKQKINYGVTVKMYAIVKHNDLNILKLMIKTYTCGKHVKLCLNGVEEKVRSKPPKDKNILYD